MTKRYTEEMLQIKLPADEKAEIKMASRLLSLPFSAFARSVVVQEARKVLEKYQIEINGTGEEDDIYT